MSDYIQLIKKLKQKRISNLNFFLNSLLGVSASIIGISLFNLINVYVGLRWFNITPTSFQIRTNWIDLGLGFISTIIIWRAIKKINGYPDLLELNYQITVRNNLWDTFIERFKSIFDEELRRQTSYYSVNEASDFVEFLYKYRNFKRFYINHSLFSRKTFIYFYKQNKKVRFLINTDYCDLVSQSINKTLKELKEHDYINSFTTPTHDTFFKSLLYPIKKKGKIVIIT